MVTAGHFSQTLTSCDDKRSLSTTFPFQLCTRTFRWAGTLPLYRGGLSHANLMAAGLASIHAAAKKAGRRKKKKKKNLEASNVQALENTSVASRHLLSHQHLTATQPGEMRWSCLWCSTKGMSCSQSLTTGCSRPPFLSPPPLPFLSLFFFFFKIRKSVYGAPVDREPVSMGTAAFQTHQTRA